MPDPQWQGLRPTGKTLDNGQPEPGKPIIINCQQTNPENCHERTMDRPDSCPGLCRDCTNDFRAVLADVPLLLDDLDIAIAGETRFVEHGTRNGTNGNTESGSGNRAIKAHHDLTAAIMAAAGWFDANTPELVAKGLLIHLNQLASLPETRNLALKISIGALDAHKAIDAPPEIWFYGACPDCEHDIWQERIRPDDSTPVACRQRSCTYTAPLDTHHKRLLDAGNDRWMTEDELVAVVMKAGEVVTRQQIRRWRDREGLPMEIRSLADWFGTDLVTRDVEVFRLGDIRALADGEKLEGTITSREAAKRLYVAEDTIRKLVERGQLAPVRRAAKPLRFRLEEIYRYQQARLA